MLAHPSPSGCPSTPAARPSFPSRYAISLNLLKSRPRRPSTTFPPIIPQQACNRDCTVFFELYHASRESFTYLREFYIGELHAEERDLVPHGDEKASDDFYTQLREFSAPFRYDPATDVHKSF